MLKPNQVPYEVKLRLRAVLQDGECDEAVAIAAAINAWPGSEYVFRQPHRRAVSYSNPAIMLPLPMEQAVKAKEPRVD